MGRVKKTPDDLDRAADAMLEKHALHVSPTRVVGFNWFVPAHCPKCQGTVEPEVFVDSRESAPPIRGWRCVNCGERGDDDFRIKKSEEAQQAARRRWFRPRPT